MQKREGRGGDFFRARRARLRIRAGGAVFPPERAVERFDVLHVAARVHEAGGAQNVPQAAVEFGEEREGGGNLKFSCVGFKTREFICLLIVGQDMAANQVMICRFAAS